MVLMAFGMLCFNCIPAQMLRVFTKDETVIAIGSVGFRFVGASFIPMVTSLTFPVFFQAVGKSLKSSLLTIIRTLVLFVPLGFLFSRFGLTWFWLTFPVTEAITTLVGLLYYRQFLDSDYVRTPAVLPLDDNEIVLKPSKPGIIITIAREHGSSGKQIGRLVAEGLDIPFYYKEMVALAAHESGLDKEFISDIHKNAPKRYRIRRVMEIYGDSLDDARRNIRRSDKARSSYYRHISGRRWADGRHYNLSVDSSVGVEKAANLILAYVSSVSSQTI